MNPPCLDVYMFLKMANIRKGGPKLDHPPLCARHVVHLGGESPLRAVMTGTASLSKGVHREVESEGS